MTPPCDFKATVFDKTGVAPAVQELKAGFAHPSHIEGDDGNPRPRRDERGVHQGRRRRRWERRRPPSAGQTSLWTGSSSVKAVTAWSGGSVLLSCRRPSHI